ncbi:MAG: hypothetical protein AAF802_20495, partial [Planctomycetota bacterium]
MVVLCGLVGVPALMMFMSGQGTWIEGDETVLKSSKGKEVPIDSIQKIDKRKWEAKGIAKIYYEQDGKTKKFVMDDFKFDRKPMGELMLFAEANLDESQVIGDDLERDKREAAVRLAAEQEADENEPEDAPTDEEADSLTG